MKGQLGEIGNFPLTISLAARVPATELWEQYLEMHDAVDCSMRISNPCIVLIDLLEYLPQNCCISIPPEEKKHIPCHVSVMSVAD